VRVSAAIGQPTLMPDGVHHESPREQSKPLTRGQIPQHRPQSCTGRYDCQLSFAASQPRHHNAALAGFRFRQDYAAARGIRKHSKQNQHHERPANPRQPPAIRAARPRLAEAKTPEHNARRKQLNQAVSAKSQQRGAVRSPSRPRETTASALIQMSVTGVEELCRKRQTTEDVVAAS